MICLSVPISVIICVSLYLLGLPSFRQGMTSPNQNQALRVIVQTPVNLILSEVQLFRNGRQLSSNLLTFSFYGNSVLNFYSDGGSCCPDLVHGCKANNCNDGDFRTVCRPSESLNTVKNYLSIDAGIQVIRVSRTSLTPSSKNLVHVN